MKTGMRRRVRIALWSFGQPRSNRIETNISPVLLIIDRIPDAVIRKAALPNPHSGPRFFHEAMRESAFYELHGLLESDGWIGGEKQMNVIWHESEFVELKNSALAIVKQSFDEERGHAIRAKN